MTFKRVLIALLFASGGLVGECFPVRLEAPVYPPLANQARIEGVVKLKVTLARDGEVLNAQSLSGNSILARTAEANLLTWRFSRSCSSHSSSASIEFTYRFKLEGETLNRPTTEFRYDHPYLATVTSQAHHWQPERESKDEPQQ
jgi:TonB family protein